MLPTVTIETRAADAEHVGPLRPVGATAALIHRKIGTLDGRPLLYAAQTVRRAQNILGILTAFAPDRATAYLPPRDSLPGDGVGPSPVAMGRRMSVLRWLTDEARRPAGGLTTAEALLRRVPPRSIWTDRHVELFVGDGIDPQALGARLAEMGYVVDDRVDEPGEAAVRGRVVDIFPAAAPRPCRIEHENGRITAIRSYDPRRPRGSPDPCPCPSQTLVRAREGDRLRDAGIASQRAPGLKADDELVGPHDHGVGGVLDGVDRIGCPRIEDIEPMEKRLEKIVPELSVATAHGQMPAEALDEAMLDFAGGTGDVLLATNIIESGLDVPGANTMIVWRPDRFGLGQLHQLRGRVGRGSRRGIAILATDPAKPLAGTTEKRLRALEALNRLGAGFEISARDLDIRGAGELPGDEQAGHLQLIGLSLYRHVLEHALAVASGQEVAEDRVADLRLGVEGGIPKDCIPEPEMRIDLVARIAGARDTAAPDLLVGEVEDRFGALPAALQLGFDLERLRCACRSLGVHRLDAGPKAVAASFDLARAGSLAAKLDLTDRPTLRWSANRLIDTRIEHDGASTIAAALEMVEGVERLLGRPVQGGRRAGSRAKTRRGKARDASSDISKRVASKRRSATAEKAVPAG